MKTKITQTLVLLGLIAATTTVFAQNASYSSKTWLPPRESTISRVLVEPNVSMAALSSKPWLHQETEFNIAFLPKNPAATTSHASVGTQSSGGAPIDPAYSSKPSTHSVQ